ncbi:hypothetical protein ACA910_004832 [Epithemia clementina (nom. ined.)]
MTTTTSTSTATSTTATTENEEPPPTTSISTEEELPRPPPTTTTTSHPDDDNNNNNNNNNNKQPVRDDDDDDDDEKTWSQTNTKKKHHHNQNHHPAASPSPSSPLPNPNPNDNPTKSQVVFLAGCAGTGKSTLVETFVQQIQEQQQQPPPPPPPPQGSLQPNDSTSFPSRKTVPPPKLWYITGKFSSMTAHGAVPFSALSQALNQLVWQLVAWAATDNDDDDHDHDPLASSSSSSLWLQALLQRWADLDIASGTDDALVLEQALMPDLPALLSLWSGQRPRQPPPAAKTTTTKATTATPVPRVGRTGPEKKHRVGVSSSSSSSSSSSPPPPNTTTTTMMSLTWIEYALLNFVRALVTTTTTTTTTITSTNSSSSSSSPPPPPPTMLFLWFLDDLQWADAASLQLIQALCLDPYLHRTMFILAYRPNEIHSPQHDFCTLLQQPVVQQALQQPQEQQEQQQEQEQQDEDDEEDNKEDEEEKVEEQQQEEEEEDYSSMTKGEEVEKDPVSSDVSSSSSRNVAHDSNRNNHSRRVHFMELFNLSPDSIAEFIADCLDPKNDDNDTDNNDELDKSDEPPHLPSSIAWVVAQIIYQKTLGNIFNVKQALEELVRKNALYYDTISFEWQFVVTGAPPPAANGRGSNHRSSNSSSVLESTLLSQFLSEDVILMVQGKLQTLPPPLQRALILAAYTTPTVIELTLLQALLQGTRRPSLQKQKQQRKQPPQSSSSSSSNHHDTNYYSLPALERWMQRAFHEGLVLYAASPTWSSPSWPQQEKQQRKQDQQQEPARRQRSSMNSKMTLLKGTATTAESSMSSLPFVSSKAGDNNSNNNNNSNNHHDENPPPSTPPQEEEGLVLYDDGPSDKKKRRSCCYQFAHDRIREAACAMVPAGRKRNHLLLRISKVLLQQYHQHQPPYPPNSATAAASSLGCRATTTTTTTTSLATTRANMESVGGGSGDRPGGGGQQQQLNANTTNANHNVDSNNNNNNKDWMLFTAARHLNSLPQQLIDEDAANSGEDCSVIDLPRLNLIVGKIAVSKGAFQEATHFLQEGVQRLDPNTCWKDDANYTLTLELKITLAQAEKNLGHNDKALELVEDVFQHAKSLQDKSAAHVCYIEATNCKNDNNYAKSVDAALGILPLYDIHVPSSPSQRQVKMERLLLRLALRGRSISCLAKFPETTDVLEMARMKVAFMTMLYAMFGKRANLAILIGYRMLRVALNSQTITKDLPSLLVSLGGQLRENRKYKSAFKFANTAISIMDRFRDEKGLEYFRAKLALYASLYCLHVPVRDCIEALLDLHKWGYAQGETENGLGSGMMAMYAFMVASLPLNALFEPKLVLFEELALRRGRKNFVIIFSLIRQYLYNLQGGPKASPVPSKVNGAAFNEEEALDMLKGPVRKQNLRDIGVIRLQLAVIFDDEEGMEEMLDLLDEYPTFDILTLRQHLRMTYMGFASLILAQKMLRSPGHSYSMHTIRLVQKWAREALKFFEELSRFGSPNAQPVYACMKALSKPSVVAFDDAIKACANAGLINLAALMNERCGHMLLQENVTGGLEARRSKSSKSLKEPLYETYLKCAIWFYHDWGATGKVIQLKSKFTCLEHAMQEKAPSQLSSIRRKAARLGIPNRSITTTTTLSDV